MAGKYLDSIKYKCGITFINTPQDRSGMPGFLPLKLWIFKEEEVRLENHIAHGGEGSGVRIKYCEIIPWPHGLTYDQF